MDIEIVKKLIKTHVRGHSNFILMADEADRYYRNDTDVLRGPSKKEKHEKGEEGEKPLRNADNRIPFNFHGLLVNQKAAYMFTAPPLFDLGNKSANRALQKFLGDKFPKVCKDLCVEASNATVSWLHVWKQGDGAYNYAVVPSVQIIPIWDKSLEKKLLAVFRVYTDIDEQNGGSYAVYEYWTDQECYAYRVKTGEDIDKLAPYGMFLIDARNQELSDHYKHGMGEVPFFSFSNNNIGTNDLKNIKPLIDVYCKVFSGFVNDLEDVQEIIFVLTNYGGENLNEFLEDLNYYKAIKVENEGEGDKSGVSTLTIEIPVEAREKLLTITRKCIFEQGQGIDPDPQNFGNSSGVALGFLYSLLELKSGLQETEFRPSFGRFIRCVCRVQNIQIKDGTITQTWTRTSVRNDQELAAIASISAGIISNETVLRNHPWVEDVEKEQQRISEETEKELEDTDNYKDAFKKKDGEDISVKE